MRWQRAAQAVIAVFVIGFIVVLVLTLRQERATQTQEPPPERINEKSTLESQGGGTNTLTDPSGRKQWEIKWGTHVVLPDGRSRFSGGVEVIINRGEGPIHVEADDADVTQEEEGVQAAVFRGNVRLTGAGGLQVTTAEATYSGADGIITIPGAMEFSKGRMTGSGVGATYDQNRDVLWILDQSTIAVAPGSDGQGGLDAVAAKAGLARADHYLLLEGDARIEGEGRIIQGDQITIRLTEDDERVRMLEVRGNSRISGGQGAPQDMSARDIDLTYGDDGRTLQTARLVEKAVVQLPDQGGGAGKRVAGNTIDIAMGPDGATVTGLTANDDVQVDLPAEGESPAKRIRSATLTAAGQAGTGLRTATFAGGVEYRETHAGARGAPALNRTARSQQLLIETDPGLGALQKADFRGNVQFNDQPDFRAEAQQGVYHVAGGRLQLMSLNGVPGPASPRVMDGKVSIAARTIDITLSSREMIADASVRSTIIPQRSTKARGGETRIPSMLDQDKEVNVTSDGLSYDSAGATYTGNATLWQEKTTIKGETIHIDEKNGNLTASGGATTVFMFEETDATTGKQKLVESTGRSETFVYTDAKRLATYTGKAQINGAQGNVSGDRIDLFLKPDVNELERAEASGADGSVVVREGPRVAKGNHLTYTAADDKYLMIGTPVEVIEENKGSCSITHGAEVTFSRTSETAGVRGNTLFPHTSRTLPACPPELKR